MKATSLRIGNLVQDRHSEECGMIDIVVLGIIDAMENHSYEPIPLTEEWLKRFGFKEAPEYDKRGGYLSPVFDQPHDKRVRIHLDEVQAKFKVSPQIATCFQHVHQLQNLYFALTGQELNQNKEDES